MVTRLAILDIESKLYSVLESKYNLGYSLEQYQQSVDSSMQEIFEFTDCSHYIGFVTARSFRYDFYPEYKGTRKAKHELYYDLLKYTVDKYNLIKVEGYEADDLCASCFKWCKINQIPYIIVNIDKDLNQLEGIHYNYKDKKTYYVDNYEAMYNLAYQMFANQSADNIKPCPGIGDVSIIEILSECKTKKDFIKQVIKVYRDGYGRFKGYKDYKEKIKFFYNLVYLEQDIKFDFSKHLYKV